MSLEFFGRRRDGQGFGEVEDLVQPKILSIVPRRLMGRQVAPLDVIHDGGGLLEAQNVGSLTRAYHFGCIGVSLILLGVHLLAYGILSIFTQRASKRKHWQKKPILTSGF